jgi:membrane protein
VKQAVQGYLAHGALSRGAAIALYVVASLAPVLIVVAVAGLAFGEDAVRGKLIRELRGRRQGGEPGKNLLARSGDKSIGAAA